MRGTTGDVGIGLALRVGGCIEFQAQMAKVFASEFPDLRGILTDASREDQSVNPAQRCGHRPDSLHQPVDIDFQSQASVGTVRSLLRMRRMSEEIPERPSKPDS